VLTAAVQAIESQIPLAEYIERARRSAASRDNADQLTQYMFDSSFLLATPSLTSTLRVPEYLHFPPAPTDFFFLAIGGQGSGTGFHRHAPSWNLLAHGRLQGRWLSLLPSGLWLRLV
jgi:hypothetical protein